MFDFASVFDIKTDESTTPIVQVVSSTKQTRVQVECSAIHSNASVSLIALSLNNDYLLFQLTYNSDQASPVTRFLRWHRSPRQRIVSLSIDSSGRWLLVCTADCSLVLLPVYFLMRRAGHYNAQYPERDLARTLAKSQSEPSDQQAGSVAGAKPTSTPQAPPAAAPSASFMSSLFTRAQQAIARSAAPITGADSSQSHVIGSDGSGSSNEPGPGTGNPFDCLDDASVITAAAVTKKVDESTLETTGRDPSATSSTGAAESGSRGVGRLVGRKPGGTVSPSTKKNNNSTNLGRYRAAGAVWWRTRGSTKHALQQQQDLAVVVNAKGSVSFVDLALRRVCGRMRLRLHSPILSIRLVRHQGTNGQFYVYLMAFTLDNAVHRVLLERSEHGGGVVSVLTAPPHSPTFEPVQVTTASSRAFPPLTPNAVVAAAGGAGEALSFFSSPLLLPVLRKDSGKLDLFDADPARAPTAASDSAVYPMFSYTCPLGRNVRLAVVPSPYWFACAIPGFSGGGGNVESLVLLSRQGASPHDNRSNAVLASFPLARGERILALEPVWGGSLVCVTSLGVYECRLTAPPAALFRTAVRTGDDRQAGLIGSTWQLDVLDLYAEGAQEACGTGHVDRAIALWGKAGLTGVSLASHLVGLGRFDGAKDAIARAMANPAALSPAMRRQTLLAAALLKCVDRLSSPLEGDGSVATDGGEDDCAAALAGAAVAFCQQARNAGLDSVMALIDQALEQGPPLGQLAVPVAIAVVSDCAQDTERCQELSVRLAYLFAKHGCSALGGAAVSVELLKDSALWPSVCVMDGLVDAFPIQGQVQVCLDCSLATLTRRFQWVVRLLDRLDDDRVSLARLADRLMVAYEDAWTRLHEHEHNDLEAVKRRLFGQTSLESEYLGRPMVLDEFFELVLVCRLKLAVPVAEEADRAILRLLAEHTGKYRAEVAVQLCMDYGAWLSAASLWQSAAKLKSPLRAFECECVAVEQKHRRSESSSPAELQSALVDLLARHAATDELALGTELLVSLYEQWERLRLPMDALERFFAQHMSQFAAMLQELLLLAQGQFRKRFSSGFQTSLLQWQSPEDKLLQKSIETLQNQIGKLERQQADQQKEKMQRLSFRDFQTARDGPLVHPGELK